MKVFYLHIPSRKLKYICHNIAVVLFAFTVFFVYEKKEQEIDSLCQKFQFWTQKKCNVVGKVSTSQG